MQASLCKQFSKKAFQMSETVCRAWWKLKSGNILVFRPWQGVSLWFCRKTMVLGGKKCFQLAWSLLCCLLSGCVPCVFRVVGCSSSLLWPRRGCGRQCFLEVGARSTACQVSACPRGCCLPPWAEAHSLTVLFISVMQEMHRARVPPVPHLRGQSKDTGELPTTFLYSAVYV